MATRGFSSLRTNQLKKTPKRQRLVDVQTNTEPDLYLPESTSNTSVDVIKYFQALNYINEIHTAINDDIKRLQLDKCAGCSKMSTTGLNLPGVPNYLGILATYNFNEQVKCGKCTSKTVTTSGSETKTCEEFAKKNLEMELQPNGNPGELSPNSTDGLQILHKQAPPLPAEINDESTKEKKSYQKRQSSNQMCSTKPTSSKHSKQMQVVQRPMLTMVGNLSDLELDRYASELLLPPKKFDSRQLPSHEATKVDKSSQVNNLPVKICEPQLQLIHSAGDSVHDRKQASGDKCLETNNHKHVSMTIRKLNDTFRRLSNGNDSSAIQNHSPVTKRAQNCDAGEIICLGKRNSGGSFILSDKDEQSGDSDIEEDSDDVKTVHRSSALVSSCSLLTHNPVRMITDSFNRQNHL